MKIAHKLQYATQHIQSISQHDDVDLAVREAALDQLAKFIETERQAARERQRLDIAAELTPPSDAPDA